MNNLTTKLSSFELLIQQTALNEHRLRKADETNRANATDVTAFQHYMDALDQRTGDLLGDLANWTSVTHGHVKTFQLYMINRGYAINTINRRISTLKSYSKLANEAGHLDSGQALRISHIRGYSNKEGQRADQSRETERIGNKKQHATTITPEQARLLKCYPRYDLATLRTNLIFSLLLDHACRVSEVVKFTTGDIKDGMLIIHRLKTSTKQTHKQTADSARAINEWMHARPISIFDDTPLICHLETGRALTDRMVRKLVKRAGERIGIDGLSPHDGRHWFATEALRAGSDIEAVRSAGNWASLASMQRYVKEVEISNEEVILP